MRKGGIGITAPLTYLPLRLVCYYKSSETGELVMKAYGTAHLFMLQGKVLCLQ